MHAIIQVLPVLSVSRVQLRFSTKMHLCEGGSWGKGADSRFNDLTQSIHEDTLLLTKTQDKRSQKVTSADCWGL